MYFHIFSVFLCFVFFKDSSNSARQISQHDINSWSNSFTLVLTASRTWNLISAKICKFNQFDSELHLYGENWLCLTGYYSIGYSHTIYIVYIKKLSFSLSLLLSLLLWQVIANPNTDGDKCVSIWEPKFAVWMHDSEPFIVKEVTENENRNMSRDQID